MWRPLTIACLCLGGITLPTSARAGDPTTSAVPTTPAAPTAPAAPATSEAPATSAPPTADTPPPFDARQELDTAIQSFLDGDSAGARDRLRALLSRGPELEAGVRHDALAYLGDILLTEDDVPSARATFEALLDEDPSYRMDPIKHPPEVARYFEDLRVSRRTIVTVPPVATPREPFPALALVPLGVHWMAKKKVGTGLLIGGLQVAAAATNLAFYTQVKNYQGYTPRGSEEEAAFIRMEVAADVSAAIAWGAWLVPASIEVGRWASTPRVAVTPTVNGVALTGTF